jgi:hypothetical protein
MRNFSNSHFIINENFSLYYREISNDEIDELHELHESDDLSPDSPNFYSLEELAKMTPEELIAIGYPNPNEFQLRLQIRKLPMIKGSFLI